MTFTQAVESGFANYANFSARSSRSAFWYWVLFGVIVEVALSAIDRAMDIGIIQLLVGLGLILPNLSVAVRRLHDINKSGWNVLWALIPILGLIYLIYLYVQPSDPGPNEYGVAPLAAG